MEQHSLTGADHHLIEEAMELYRERFVPGEHLVTAGLLTASGNTYLGINMRPDIIGNAEIHAEPVALGQAVLARDTDLETSVAVWSGREGTGEELSVISACGVCRELIKNYDPETMIVIPGDEGPVKCSVTDLLPARP